MSDNITLPREVAGYLMNLLEELSHDRGWFWSECDKVAFAALRTALAAPRPEPVAWMYVNSEGECEQIEYGTEAIDDDSITPLYAAPPAAAPSEDIEALRRDAERYRWLRERAWFQFEFDGRYGDSGETVQQLDAAIDAAMQGVPR